MSHPSLTRCDEGQLEQELRSSKEDLEEMSGCRVDFFAYPTGDYNARVARAVARAGYRAAFALESWNLGLGRYEIPRVEIYESGAPYLSLKLSGLHRRAVFGDRPWGGDNSGE